MGSGRREGGSARISKCIELALQRRQKCTQDQWRYRLVRLRDSDRVRYDAVISEMTLQVLFLVHFLVDLL